VNTVHLHAIEARTHASSRRARMSVALPLLALAACASRSERLPSAEKCIAAEVDATRAYALCMLRAPGPRPSANSPNPDCERALLADWDKIRNDISKCQPKYASASPQAAMHFAAVLLCGGAIVGETCWHLGADGQSCTQVCADHGQTYDPLTATYAGSAGTDDHCQSVLSALGVKQPFAGHPSCGTLPNGLGLGCLLETHDGQYGVRCARPDTTADAAGLGPGVFRACACR